MKSFMGRKLHEFKGFHAHIASIAGANDDPKSRTPNHIYFTVELENGNLGVVEFHNRELLEEVLNGILECSRACGWDLKLGKEPR